MRKKERDHHLAVQTINALVAQKKISQADAKSLNGNGITNINEKPVRDLLLSKHFTIQDLNTLNSKAALYLRSPGIVKLIEFNILDVAKLNELDSQIKKNLDNPGIQLALLRNWVKYDDLTTMNDDELTAKLETRESSFLMASS